MKFMKYITALITLPALPIHMLDSLVHLMNSNVVEMMLLKRYSST